MYSTIDYCAGRTVTSVYVCVCVCVILCSIVWWIVLLQAEVQWYQVNSREEQ